MSAQKRPGGPAAAAPPKRPNTNTADVNEDEDPGWDEEDMLAMEEEMADEAGQDVDGPAPPDEEVAACLTKTQFAACAKQWTRPALRPLDPATDELTFQQSEVCRRRCPRRPPTFTTTALTTSTVATASRRQHHPNHHANHHTEPPPP